jgi:uncharacterized membrane protein
VIGPLFAFLTALSFGVTNVIIRRGIPAASTGHGILVMTFTNFALLAPFLVGNVLLRGWPGGGPSVSAIAWFAAAGMASPMFGQLMLMRSISRIGASRAGAVKSAAPVITVLLAFLVLGETLSTVAVAGMCMVFAGLSLLMVNMWRNGSQQPEPEALLSEAPPLGLLASPRASTRRPLVVGVVMGGLAATGFGAGQLFRKVGMEIMPDAPLRALIGALTALVTVLVMQRVSPPVTPAAWLELRSKTTGWMLVAGLTTAAGQLLFFMALHTLEVSRVALIVSADLVITIMLAALLLRRYERVTPTVAVSAILVFAGVVAVSVG